MNSMELVKLDNISFGYSGSTNLVLRNFFLGIQSGTVTAILGPNGAGKTTLLHLVLGWLQPKEGILWLDCHPLKSYSRREMGHWMALVPQNEHIPFEFSLLEFVLLGRAPYLPALAMPGEEDYQIAEEALEKVGLIDLKDRSILSLSGGERQLVLMARALVQQPRLLLLDEPTSHLDLNNKERLIRLLRELYAQGVAILFTTHEPEVASALATHLVLIQKGLVLTTGELNAVFTTENLTQLYQLPVEVVEIGGRRVALWT
jgi:iron complex transport system ATP-binding protein